MNSLRPRTENRALARLLPLLAVLLSVTPGWADETLRYETFLNPSRTIEISTPYRERIQEILVRENDRVRKGQVVVKLDDRILRSRLAQARAAADFHGQIDAAKAQVLRQENRLAMLKKLRESGTVRPQELETVRTDLAVAKARLQMAREEKRDRQLAVAVIEAQLAEKELHSPLDGVVARIFRHEQELTGNTGEPIMVLVKLDPLHAEFYLPPATARILSPGQRLSLETETGPIDGTVDFISPVIDAKSGTIMTRFLVPNPGHTITSGSRCSLIIKQDAEKNDHE